MVTRQELQDDLFPSGICVTERMISNKIQRNNLKSRSYRNTPLIVKRHRDVRLEFVREHKDIEKSYWGKVLWTDESKIELFGRNSRNHILWEDGHAFKPKKTIQTVTFGGGNAALWSGDVFLQMLLATYQ